MLFFQNFEFLKNELINSGVNLRLLLVGGAIGAKWGSGDEWRTASSTSFSVADGLWFAFISGLATSSIRLKLVTVRKRRISCIFWFIHFSDCVAFNAWKSALKNGQLLSAPRFSATLVRFYGADFVSN